jgi:hypothetical protein
MCANLDVGGMHSRERVLVPALDWTPRYKVTQSVNVAEQWYKERLVRYVAPPFPHARGGVFPDGHCTKLRLQACLHSILYLRSTTA